LNLDFLEKNFQSSVHLETVRVPPFPFTNIIIGTRVGSFEMAARIPAGRNDRKGLLIFYPNVCT
jgi:hypothetical protein